MPVVRRGPARAAIVSLAGVGVTLVAALPLAAQPVPADPQRPIGPFVVDVRGALPRYPATDAIASPRGLTVSDLPTFGWGLDIGAHVYPLRGRVVTLGLGASLLLSRRGRMPESPAGASSVVDPAVTTRLSAFSPQVSFNFGRGGGWSYLSGGIGRSTLTVSRADLVDEEGEGVKTINYGGGARWFTGDHVAVTFDLRFYAINPQEATAAAAGHPRLTQVVLSAGVSFR
jgi:hypothetical protein